MSANHKPKILIFTSKTGGGHVSQAEGLRDLLAGDYEIEILDPQPGIIHLHYRLVSRYALWVWASEYHLTDGRRRSRLAHKISSVLLEKYIKTALLASQPDLVMSTYPFLTSEVTYAMRRIGCTVPFMMLFTDPYKIHQSWLTERRTEAVLAPTRETYEQALSAEFEPEHVYLSGVPIRAQFYRSSLAARGEMLAGMGLDPASFTVFLQGGGEGSAKFVRTVENVLRLPGTQIILAAGTNRRLYDRFHGTAQVHALPFTREIAPFMAAADVVMGKAGASMLFEAVTLGKPFIATAYIPGQEQGNIEFLLRHKLGWVALDAETQQALLRSLKAQEPVLQEVQASVEAYRQWNLAANEAIPQVVKNLVKS